MNNPEEYLDQIQVELENVAPDVEHFTGVDRRQFVFRSLVVAAASTFAAKSVHAQSGLGGPFVPPSIGDTMDAIASVPRLFQTPQQAAPFPLGNGEPPAEQFMPYPGGTGALLDRMYRERGAAAFKRSEFVVPKWEGPVPTSDEDIAFLPAHQLSALIKEKKLTSMRLTKIYLDRLKKYNPTLLCAVTIMEAQGMAEAQLADSEIAAGRYRGPLHGIPYGVKDLFNTRGVPTTWGAKDFADRIIDDDAEIVVRLRNAGAVLIAKLSTGLFAQNDQWFRGRTNNPWNLSQGSSGSSAGPASATAAGCVAFGIGTETSGSIVSPAIRCGVSALRPTFGRVSRAGGMVLSWSQDRVGPITRTVMDSAMVFNAVHGADEKDPSTITMPFQFDSNIKLSGLRVGVDPGRAPAAGGAPPSGAPQGGAPPEFVAKLTELGMKPVTIGARPTVAGMAGGGLNAEYAAAFDSYVQRKARETGLDLNALPEPTTPGTGRGALGGGAGAGRGAGAAPAAPADPMAPADWNPRFVGGRTIRAYDFINNQRRRYILISEWGVFMKDLDMFIAGPSTDVGQNAQTGHPCVVVQYKFEPPAQGFGGRGGAAAAPAAPALNAQPICATIIGALYNDDKILSVAHQFQSHTDILKHRPTIS